MPKLCGCIVADLNSRKFVRKNHDNLTRTFLFLSTRLLVYIVYICQSASEFVYSFVASYIYSHQTLIVLYQQGLHHCDGAGWLIKTSPHVLEIIGAPRPTQVSRLILPLAE